MNSIPVSRAVELGARTVYVLQVGRIERPLQPPTRPWEVALVAFEIARRHRFATDMANLPDDVVVHVLPTGDEVPGGLAQLRYRDVRRVGRRGRAGARGDGGVPARARAGDVTVPLPPRWVRRPLSVSVLLLLALGVTLLPLLVVVAALASALLPGRFRALRLLGFALVWLALETAGLLAALLLWVASGFGWKLRSPAFQRAHWAVLHALLAEAVATARVLFHLHLDTAAVSWSPLDDGVPGSTGPMLVLSRHAGPGDSLLLVRTLLDRDHLRRPRIVLKDVLQWDPLVDVYLNRLPSAFLSTGDGMAERIAGLAADLGDEDALLVFPEGGNFTEGRRRRAIDRLRGKGMLEQAEAAEAMRHLLPPRPGGVAAARAAAPHADVVLVGHTGLEHLSTAADLWDGLPMDGTVRLRWWFHAADEVPRDEDELERWLYDRWAEIDAWIASEGRRATV